MTSQYVESGHKTLASLNEAVSIKGAGIYRLDFGQGPFNVWVDHDGWILILQYIRSTGSNQPLHVIGFGSDWPMMSTSKLTTDLTTPAYYGHISQAVAASIPDNPNFLNLKWFGATIQHNRRLHFRSYILGDLQSNNPTNFLALNNPDNLIKLNGHTTFLPLSANNTVDNQGNLALTNYPFYQLNQHYWSMRGGGNRWEMDFDAKQITTQPSTIHRVWIRYN